MYEKVTREDAELIRDLLIRLTGSWSANAVVKILQSMDLGIRRQDALALVRGYLGSGKRRSERQNQMEFGVDLTGSGTTLGTTSGTSYDGPKTSENQGEKSVPGHAISPHTPSFNIASELRSSGILSHFVRSSAYSKRVNAQEENPVPDALEKAPWIAMVGTEFRKIVRTRIRDLNPDQRLVMGRTFALFCANYRIDEGKNIDAGSRFAAQFARMGNIRRFEELTCAQYLQFAIKTLQIRRGRPFHNVFDAETAMEYSDAE